MTPEELEATLRANILSVVAEHGGERILAGPQIELLVDELTQTVMELMRQERS